MRAHLSERRRREALGHRARRRWQATCTGLLLVAFLVAATSLDAALATGLDAALTAKPTNQPMSGRRAPHSARTYSPRTTEAEFPQSARYVWENGPPSDPSYFPIGVWLQHYDNAPAYREIGINVFIGQWQGPTENQLNGLAAAGMPTIASQNGIGLAHLDDPTLLGWLQQDEPDNAQPDGQGGYGPCIDPEEVISRYREMKANDASRPVLLNLGQGVAWDYDRPYVGRGSACSRRWDQYLDYVQAADIVSFDIYPVTSPYEHIRDQLWLVARGVERLREWTGDGKIVWNVIETTHVKSESMPTPEQVRAEVWMSLIHGSMGIVYFAHEWEPQFREAALLHYPSMRTAVARINAEIMELAPVLNRQEAVGAVSVESSSAEIPIGAMAKVHEGWLYVFCVAMRDGETDATVVPAIPVAADPVEVIGEDRTIGHGAAGFRDSFDGYDVHLYRFRLQAPALLPLVHR